MKNKKWYNSILLIIILLLGILFRIHVYLVNNLGFSELAFRLIPFFSSIMSVLVFYFLSRKMLEKSWTRLFALLLFYINFQLLFYTQTFKQYSSDVLISIIILLVAFLIDLKKIKWQNILLLGLLSTIAFCFSFTALSVIIGVMIVHLFFSTKFISRRISYLRQDLSRLPKDRITWLFFVKGELFV